MWLYLGDFKMIQDTHAVAVESNGVIADDLM